jgi:lactate dehydrogenase-like 2-hydroxyacid dehydrogenase
MAASTKPEILVMVPIYAPALAQLEHEFVVHKLWQAADPQKFMKELAGSVRVVVTTGLLGLRRADIDLLPQLELIACFGTPHGTIDHEVTSKRGIVVTNTPDRIAEAVAELAAGMTVALMRRICENDRFVRAGRWPHGAPAAGNTLVGKTCGIVGLGRIGRETATRLAAFGMSVSYQGPRRKPDVSYSYFANVAALAQHSDCLVVTCAATPETHNLIDARIFDAIGPEGFLVNVARAAIVDEAALLAALETKRIAGAALDVFWNEPRVPQQLMGMDNVVLLPHVGSTTREIRDERGRKLMANLRAHFCGQPLPNLVTR